MRNEAFKRMKQKFFVFSACKHLKILERKVLIHLTANLITINEEKKIF